jgi:predicted anti-sigma-YlaC factor YlaD
MSELVTDYLEGDLPLHKRVSARVHLLLCTACTRYFDQMRRTIRLLRAAPALALAPDREDAIMRAIESRPDAP